MLIPLAIDRPPIVNTDIGIGINDIRHQFSFSVYRLKTRLSQGPQTSDSHKP